MPRRGFTLIELLVVIAIIAILAAILFPVFAKAREKARQASCQSNLKQVALSFAQYAQDFDEKLPWCCVANPRTGRNDNLDRDPWWRPGTNTTTDIRYNGLLMPYIKNRQVFVCPSGLRDINSYAAPRQLMQGSNGCIGQPLGNVLYPAEHVLCGDGTGTRGYCGSNRATACQGRWGLGDGTATQMTAWQVHNGGTNLAFVDGHVKWQAVPSGQMDSARCTRMFGNPATP